MIFITQCTLNAGVYLTFKCGMMSNLSFVFVIVFVFVCLFVTFMTLNMINSLITVKTNLVLFVKVSLVSITLIITWREDTYLEWEEDCFWVMFHMLYKWYICDCIIMLWYKLYQVTPVCGVLQKFLVFTLFHY